MPAKAALECIAVYRAPLGVAVNGVVTHVPSDARSPRPSRVRMQVSSERADITVAVNGSQLCCMNSLEALIGTLRELVVTAAEEYIRGNPGLQSTPLVHLDLRPPLLLFALRTDTCAHAPQVARLLHPAPADRVWPARG